jgi:hypothetical protein
VVSAPCDHPRPHLVTVCDDILDPQIQALYFPARRLDLDLEDLEAGCHFLRVER